MIWISFAGQNRFCWKKLINKSYEVVQNLILTLGLGILLFLIEQLILYYSTIAPHATLIIHIIFVLYMHALLSKQSRYHEWCLSGYDLATGMAHKSSISPELVNQHKFKEWDHKSPNQVLRISASESFRDIPDTQKCSQCPHLY